MQTAASPVSLLALKDAPDFSGVLVRPDGRVAVLSRGKGFALRMTADELHDLAHRCAAMAAMLAEKEAEAAAEASEELARIGGGVDD